MRRTLDFPLGIGPASRRVTFHSSISACARAVPGCAGSARHFRRRGRARTAPTPSQPDATVGGEEHEQRRRIPRRTCTGVWPVRRKRRVPTACSASRQHGVLGSIRKHAPLGSEMSARAVQPPEPSVSGHSRAPRRPGAWLVNFLHEDMWPVWAHFDSPSVRQRVPGQLAPKENSGGSDRLLPAKS